MHNLACAYCSSTGEIIWGPGSLERHLVPPLLLLVSCMLESTVICVGLGFPGKLLLDTWARGYQTPGSL